MRIADSNAETGKGIVISQGKAFRDTPAVPPTDEGDSAVSEVQVKGDTARRAVRQSKVAARRKGTTTRPPPKSLPKHSRSIGMSRFHKVNIPKAPHQRMKLFFP